MTTDTIKNILDQIPRVPGLGIVISCPVSVRVCFARARVLTSVRLLVQAGPGGCQVAEIPGPAHASIFGHTQFSQFPQTAPSPQSRLDIDRDNTTHKSYY